MRARRPLTRETALGAAESARGETLYWLEADGGERAAVLQAARRVVRELRHLQPRVRSQVLTDFSFIEHSLGLSPAGCDA